MIKGTRIPVSVILDQIAEGESWDTLLVGYPELKKEDIQAALIYARTSLDHTEVRAVYSGGVLKPFKKLNLVEGQKVEIEIKEGKGKKNISLRGLWKASKVSEKDIDKAKHIWEKGVKKQIKFLEED